MKIRKSIASLAAMFTVLVMGLPSIATADTYQIGNFIDFDTGRTERSAATLTRSMNEVWANLSLSGLRSRTPYTVWWVVWNDPSLCNGACGDEEIDFGVAGNAVFYAGGFIASPGGIANISVHMKGGVMPDPIDIDGIVAPIPGMMMLDNGYGVEAHLVVRRHRYRVLAGQADVMVGTFDGACGPPPQFKGCADEQAIAFAPVVP